MALETVAMVAHVAARPETATSRSLGAGGGLWRLPRPSTTKKERVERTRAVLSALQRVPSRPHPQPLDASPWGSRICTHIWREDHRRPQKFKSIVHGEEAALRALSTSPVQTGVGFFLAAKT